MLDARDVSTAAAAAAACFGGRTDHEFGVLLFLDGARHTHRKLNSCYPRAVAVRFLRIMARLSRLEMKLGRALL